MAGCADSTVPSLLPPCHQALSQQPQTHQENLPFTLCQAILLRLSNQAITSLELNCYSLGLSFQLLSNQGTDLVIQPYLYNPFLLGAPLSSSCSPGHKATVSLDQVSQVTSHSPHSPTCLFWQDWQAGKESTEASLLELGPWREPVLQSHLLCVQNSHACIPCGAQSPQGQNTGWVSRSPVPMGSSTACSPWRGQDMIRAGCASASNSSPSSLLTVSSLTVTPALPSVIISIVQMGKQRQAAYEWLNHSDCETG